jgi:hypothetical protein
MLKRSIILLLALSILFPVVARAERTGIVINRFQISGSAGSNDEFVELMNTSTVAVDISSWKLAKKSASASATISYLRTIIPEGTTIAAKEKLVIAHPDWGGTPGLDYATTTGNAPSGIAADNTILILDKEKVVIDKVGFGKAADFETAVITDSPKEEEIYARKNNGQDTENNKQDFYLAYAPPVEPDDETEAEERQAPPPSLGTTPGAKLRVSEFMVNPEGADAEGEWIEIYNAGGEANISGYLLKDKMGSPKKYTFPKGTIIKSKQYLAFYSGKTPISLNNDGDAVEILTPDGSSMGQSDVSGKGPEGASFAFSGTGWAWTTQPTPGSANVIKSPVAGGDKKKESGEVLSLVDENELPTEAEITKSRVAKQNDQLLGYGLIVLAILGGISYTLYVNKEKIRGFYYHKVRPGNGLTGSEIRQRIKRRRDISSNR